LDKQEFMGLLEEILEMEDQTITATDKFRDYEAWDSLAVLSVMAMINEEFDIIIHRKVFDKLQTVEDLFKFVTEIR